MHSRPTFAPKVIPSGGAVALWLRFFVWGALGLISAQAADKIRVRHEPLQPRSGQAVRITVDPGLSAASEPVLEYQVVTPGKYVAKADKRFERDWVAAALVVTDGGAFTAELPATLQQNRNLIRYRIRSAQTKERLLPPKDDAPGNFAYFVYDGVPAWRGAVNPKGDGAAREVKTFSPSLLTNLAVYHLLAAAPAVEEVMWKPGGDGRHAYGHTGTFVYEGIVYDHVQFRARGGSWRHSMGKNMWKFNFNAGDRLAAKDFYGRPYASKWDKLNLGACIQQGDYQRRGEQGMFEALTFRLFNLAGADAPRTHWVHLRVVTDAEETPANQYRGDFWGLYLAVEEIDGDFLKEHGLPDGNVYKIEGFQPQPQHFAKGTPAKDNDAREFLAALLRGGGRGRIPSLRGAESWWSDTVDLARYYGYRSVVEAVHHYDIGGGKNYFFYHNLTAKRWQVVPWDVDLTWGDHMFGDGREPFSGILSRNPFREAYQQRLAELRDLLLNPDQLGRLIDEHAAMIWNGDAKLSLADADRAKWDYHPIMSSGAVMSGKSDPGLFYFGKTANRFGVMPALMKDYVQRRQRHLDRLLVGYTPSPAPQLTGPPEVALATGKLALAAKLADPAGAGKLQWRLAEVTDSKSPAFQPKQPWRYEVEAVWQAETATEPRVEIPLAGLAAGHTYRVRVRNALAQGPASRWSAPVEFVAK
jgi:hypothetical protein